jgi:hypothetical protein
MRPPAVMLGLGKPRPESRAGPWGTPSRYFLSRYTIRVAMASIQSAMAPRQ